MDFGKPRVHKAGEMMPEETLLPQKEGELLLQGATTQVSDENVPRPSYEHVQINGPHLWFKRARALRRKVIMHVGPTNSGKTYRALKALETAESGVYASPLRLLAWQISQELGCTLITGQERIMGDNPNVTSCTVEMTPLVDVVDVGVVDEFQLMGDRNRGWAFTRAVLGMPARELHLCGEEGAVELVKKICALTGDELEVNYYQRLSPLEAEPKPLSGYQDIRPGDCVVAFSRRDIHKIRDKIEAASGHKCAIIYGGLPPEIRKAQATKFNSPESKQNVLVATDAVGMGLNLRVKRIVFSKMEKFDGQIMRRLSLREVKQIAGRAGRYGRTEEAKGLVTALDEADMGLIRLALPHAAPVISHGYVFPPREFIRARFHNVCVDLLETIRDQLLDQPLEQEFVDAVDVISSGDSSQRSHRDAIRAAKRVVFDYQDRFASRVANAFNDALVEVLREVEEASNARSVVFEKRSQLADTVQLGTAARKDQSLSVEERERLETNAQLAASKIAELDEHLQGDFSGDFLIVQRTKNLRELIAEFREVPLDVDTILQVCNAPVDKGNIPMVRHVRRYLRLTHERSVRDLIASLEDPFLEDYFSDLYRYEDVRVHKRWRREGPMLKLDRLPGISERRLRALEPQGPRGDPKNSLERRMQDYEQYYNLIDVSLWLGLRFEHPPDHMQRLGALKATCLDKLERMLQSVREKASMDDVVPHPKRGRTPPTGRRGDTSRRQMGSSPDAPPPSQRAVLATQESLSLKEEDSRDSDEQEGKSKKASFKFSH
ncbi:ATP-dependent RNA helicase SUV3, mitochondrial [Hondaea fermentalgiana]|uniref:ATP-dependent RNA helicase SUV3, mitochondrial n=1 Tax=Hondaea fermentalgiana TaxID=2315210 RepID=A0A2R5GYS9_9STRA|nr:ATP-dependent RNA helicase SUV3, mitochondrial [Hondaea fermentalgiana]|eukprot:GBG33893.1 ATP-dependent RNA helicase SUV3, mitochondrial [Hondaea fermentalgiana]